MSHLVSAQRGKSTWRVISALDCPMTSAPRIVLHALLHVDFHAILAHEDVDQDPRRSTNCWNVDRRQSEEGAPLEKGDLRFLLDELVVDTADDVCGIVRGSAIDGVLLAGQAGNRQAQRTSNRLNVRGGSSYETDFRINDGGMCGGPHSCTIELQAD